MKCVEFYDLNRQLYNLTFCPPTIQLLTHKVSKKGMRLNYKQYKRSLCENGDMVMDSMAVG